jgi:hypothetical protein
MLCIEIVGDVDGGKERYKMVKEERIFTKFYSVLFSSPALSQVKIIVVFLCLSTKWWYSTLNQIMTAFLRILPRLSVIFFLSFYEKFA